MSGLDLDAYLARIGAGTGSRPSLAQLHRAHLCAIPFENLDPHRGIAVDLELAVLQDKLLRHRRGGYCFEQNLLLKAALEALGHRVRLHLARVRWNSPADVLPSRSHLVLSVEDGDARWLADVGFGPGSLLEPIPFGPTGPHDQSGWQLRSVEEHGQLILQTRMDDDSGGNLRDAARP
jgi:N-hydroxyarylamine O-acetyltransferase